MTPPRNDIPLTASEMEDLSRKTLSVYERNATYFDKARTRAFFEKGWLDRFLGALPADGKVLDVGCGTGDPIGTYIVARGYHLTGIDGAVAMIDLARARLPDADWQVMDMTALSLSETFDGIIGWNSFFHLRQEDQRKVLPDLARLLNSGGHLMLTVGPQAGEVAGHVGADSIYHASLSPEDYGSTLTAHGCEIVDFVPEDPTCNGQTVLLAKKNNV